jgi:serine/threonine protein kinase
MTLDPQRAKSLFLAALDHASGERAAFLDEACAGDAELRRRVERLLQAHDRPDSLPEAPAAPGPTEDSSPPGGGDSVPGPIAAAEVSGMRIGPYKLLEQIGEGGMGTVWMAQQTAPVKRPVALKLIKAGMDSKQVLARFEAERQALALMDHPNIAKVLDAGTTSAGRPYFVMDLVKGVPITRYCDEHHLTPRQRLELFLPVCQAVQHAHQKGIIHRDLKPSNVLVALYDGRPVPKVIDFGVAKAAGQPLTDKTLVTGFGAIVGTLEYMSPEQAQINQLDIDTRSDIYALGVLLYELLTGTTPLEPKRVKTAGLLEALRIIREEETPRPSTRLSAAEGLPTIAANRGTEPKKLAALFRGELDWIVMKALEKDRNRRYETANGLAMDVQRYLADEPVLACPPSAGYRLRKFVRRNKRGLAVAALVLFFLVLLGSGLGWAVRDRTARIAAIDHEAALAVDEANRHQEQRQWTEALSAAKRADGLLGNEGSEELRRRVRDLRRDLEMVIRMEQIRDEVMIEVADDQKITFDLAKADREYLRAFAEYGVDIHSIPVEEAAQRLRAGSIAAELAAALDNWALARSSLAKGDKSWQRLIVLAKAADPDEWRGRLRDAWARKDRPALQALAASEQVHLLPPHTLFLLGVTLREVGDLDGAVTFLRKAQQLHPDDFWINMQLVLYYGWEEVKPRQRGETMRYAMAANAVRKQSAVPYRYLDDCFVNSSPVPGRMVSHVA